MTITVLGSFAVGLTLRAERFPVRGETLVGRDFDQGPGGKGSNQAVQIARLGGDVGFVGVIGTDAFGDMAVRLYAEEGVDTTYLVRTQARNTGLGFIVLDAAGDRLDMVYFYDDIATQQSLMISKKMWRQYVRPHHARLIEVAHQHGKPVMYHTDGAVRQMIPELIDMGVDLLNPLQPDAKDMDLGAIKAEFGGQLAFHGGVDIMRTLPKGKPEQVQAEVRERVRQLGPGGGYILCSSHHIQPDTPIANVIAMYDPALRRLD